MLTFLTTNLISIISTLVSIAIGYAYVKFRSIQNCKDIQRVECKFDGELKEMKQQEKEDIVSVRTEITEVKDCLMNTNTQIVNKLDELAKDVKNIAVDLAYFKGQQSKA